MIWEKGLGYRHHIETSHSGLNAWHTSKTFIEHPDYTNQWVESPYFNLSATTEPIYINFWFKDDYNFQGDIYTIDYSTNCSSTWTSLIEIPENTTDEWEYVNLLLNSTITANPNVKFRITYTKGYQDPEGLIFDDFYIGPAKSDLSIEKIYSNNRFTSSNSSSDVLKYEIHNSGKIAVANATTKFYWSNDPVLDSNDVLLGEQIVSNFGEQSKQWKEFSYLKPTTAVGNYYVIYQLDTNNEVIELRESNNVGFFPIEQLPTINFPYFNDFETEITNWRHDATLGEDDWAHSTPNGINLSEAFSGTKAWIATNSNNAISSMSRMHLYTPAFDLSSSTNPVLEFDMKLENFGCNCSDFTINMSYSIDNGASWSVLNPVNDSFSKWQTVLKYYEETGLDTNYNTTLSDKMFDHTENVLSNYKSYNSRDIERNTKYIINIPHLKEATNIRFRYNISTEINDGYYNQNIPLEGVIIDNFKISEATIDLSVPYSKNLLISSLADKINFAIDVKNSGNALSNETSLKFYLSNDNTLDAGDSLLGNTVLSAIKPEFKKYNSFEFLLPNNLNDYAYLIYVIDEGNLNSETDETNNIGFWDLGLAGVTSFPYSENFEEIVFNGWHGYSYDPFETTVLANYRAVNKIPLTTENSTYKKLYNGVLMTENVPYGNWQDYNTPQYYIQSPAFDFSSYASPEPLTMVFDVMSIGKPFTNGANMEYSLNGGNSWTLLTFNTAPTVNWYPNYQVLSDLNEVGWSELNGEMITSKMTISFLQNETNVIFRYKYYSNFASSADGPRGFRLDNFTIGSESDVNAINCIEAVPNLMTFEEDFEGTCWELGVNDDEIILYDKNIEQDIHWERVTNFANSTNNASLKIDLVGEGNTDGVWLVSPKYNISTADTHLRFNIALNALGSFNSTTLDTNDQIILYYSINNGLDWEELKSWDSTSVISANGQLEVIDELPVSEFVRFAFWATNGETNTGSNSTFYVDNIELFTGSLSSENFEKLELNYYPNPVKDVFYIATENQSITKIIITNSIGQILKTINSINETSYTLDFLNYPVGLYLVSIHTGDNMKTIKVIKQ